MSRKFEHECEQKIRYGSRRAARRARNRSLSSKASRLSIYRCSWCGYFHLGHLPPAVRRGELSKDAWRGDV